MLVDRKVDNVYHNAENTGFGGGLRGPVDERRAAVNGYVQVYMWLQRLLQVWHKAHS